MSDSPSPDVFAKALQLEEQDRAARLRVAALHALVTSPDATLGEIVSKLASKRSELATQMRTITIGEIIAHAVSLDVAPTKPPRKCKKIRNPASFAK